MDTEQTIKQASLEERKQIYQKLMSNLPNKIPVVIDKHPDFPNSKDIKAHKLFIDETFSVAEFLKQINQDYLSIDSLEDITIYMLLKQDSLYQHLEI